MALDVTLSVRKTDLVLKEDTVSTITATNTGQETLHVVNLGTNRRALRVKIVDVHSRIERIYQHTRQVRRGDGFGLPPREQPLAPGEKFQGDYWLLDLVDGLKPGEYDISVATRYNKDSQGAESAPVRVRVAAGAST